MTAKSLSKDIILKHTTCKDIYTKFLGLNDFPKKNISSPFSEDKTPSFKVYENGTFKCNSTGKQGDVWQFVADLNSLDVKTQFKEVLQLIAKELNIESFIFQSSPKKDLLQQGKQTNCNSVATPNIVSNTNISLDIETKDIPVNIGKTPVTTELQQNCNNNAGIIATELQSKKLTIAIRDFTTLDLEYWQNLGVEKSILEKYKVHSISNYCWTGKTPINTKKEAVAFAFELNGDFKLYIPNQPEAGITKNVLPAFPNNPIFGLEQLAEKTENIVICEGEKDTIVAHSRGFNAVTFGSGSIHSKQENIKSVQLRCNNLFVCFDTDDTGITGMQKLIESNPNIIPLYLPKNEKIKNYDVTDYFQEHTDQDFQKIIDLAVKNKSVVKLTENNENADLTIFHKAENYLSKNYDIRFDIIANEIEISKKNENNWGELNEDHLYVEMQKKHLKISIGNLRSVLASDFVPKFNPIKNYFENLPVWDKKNDYINQFLNYVELEVGEDREQFIHQFKKWCVRSVKCSTIEGYYNKQAFVLSDDAKGQNIGKTTFIRYLTPKALKNYYCENLPEKESDAIKRLGQNFIINLDELATLSRTDINKLKSMFSADRIKTRLPYGKKDVVIHRVANFIGSTNMSTFLVDESGSVRWLCFVVKKINFEYSDKFNIDNLWAQAYSLSKDENFKEAMTADDVKQNEIRNDKFQILSPEMELIPKYFEVPKRNEEIEHLTSTEIVYYISLYTSGVRVTAGAIGKAMPRCGFIRKKNKKGLWGYWVIKKPL